MKIFLSCSSEMQPTFERLLKKRGIHFVNDPEEIDALIIECNANSAQAYSIALTLAKKKPVLCFLKQGQKIDSSLREISKSSDLLFLEEYTEASLEKKLDELLQKVEGGVIKEVPSIKFTLRITPSMERYLQWKSQSTGVSKADFLRQVISEDIIANDPDFKTS